LAATLAAGATAAAETDLTVSGASLAAALSCHGELSSRGREPVLLIPGTGSDGAELWPTGFQRQLDSEGVPSCYLDLPDHATGDMQTSAEYVVFALRTMATRAGRPVAVYGFSQGGVLARLALTFWPDTRRLVDDVVAAASPQHGSTAGIDCAKFGCSAANWQRRRGSSLLNALNLGDETPGPTDWTTLRTLDDEIAQPASGPNPTSALLGAGNLVMQEICPGRKVMHLEMAFDAVAYAVLRDAMTSRGPASASRLPPRVCDRTYVGDEPVAQRRLQVMALNALFSLRNLTAPPVSAEPPVRLSRPLPPPPDRTAPVFARALASPATFAVDRHGLSETAVSARAMRGTTFRYTLSEAARVLFTINLIGPGPKRDSRIGRFAQDSTTGANAKRFSGRIGSKTLRPGRYRATLIATDAAKNRSKPRSIIFRVVRG